MARTEINATYIPEDETFQLMLSGGELSVVSLGLTILFTALKDGKRAGDRAMLEGMAHMIAGVGPDHFVDNVNSIMLKLDKLADSLVERGMNSEKL